MNEIELLNKAIASDPNDWTARLALADLLESDGDSLCDLVRAKAYQWKYINTLPECVLCMIDDAHNPKVVFFTTSKLKDQWGDDWDDAPFRHNAGPPYEPCCKEDYNSDGTPKWEIKKLIINTFSYMYDIDQSYEVLDRYSIKDMNIYKKCSWLRILSDDNTVTDIYAGTTLIEFCSILEKFNMDWLIQSK